MVRFAGAKNNIIYVVSDRFFLDGEYEIYEVSEEFADFSSYDILTKCKIKNGVVVAKQSSNKPAKDLRVALISNYGSQCGIGTYSGFLFDELVDLVGDYKLFIEKDTYDFNDTNKKIPNSKIVACWKRGDSLSELVKEVKAYNPDIIAIQHEFGIFPNMRYWISMLNQLSEYRIITTMHSVFYHQDKTAAEAAMPEIIVHLTGAKDVLVNYKKISSKVHVVPHGCFPCTDKSKLWNFYKSERTFIQMGFLFPYKGFENSIRAAGILKAKYPDIFFTGICSESPFAKNDHQLYYERLMNVVDELGLQDNVGLIRGYQSDNVLNSYLRMNRVAVFPYISHKEHECFGSSGAAPYVMSKNIPVITSSVHHFSNLPTIKCDTPEEIAASLDQLFSSNEAVATQTTKQNSYLEENSWKNVAQKYVDIFTNKY